MRTELLDAARREILADLAGKLETASLDDAARAKVAEAMTALLDELLVRLDSYADDADRAAARGACEFTLLATWPLLIQRHVPALVGMKDADRRTLCSKTLAAGSA